VLRLFRRPPKVAKLARKGDLDGLRQALRYEDRFVDSDGVEWDRAVPIRVEAAAALSRFYGPVVTEGLAAALDDDYPAVRLAAVRGIGDLGEPAAVEPLVRAVASWDEEIDGEAVECARRTLVRWQLEGLPEAMVEHLVRRGAPPLEQRHQAILKDLLAADPRGPAAPRSVAAALLGELERPAQDVDAAAAERVLGWIAFAAGETVVEALRSGGAPPAVARVAGALRDSRAVEPLVPLLTHPEVEMRRSAAAALGDLSDTRAVPSLLGATQDPDQSVRDAASTALNSMGMAAVIVGLAAILLPRDASLEEGLDGASLLSESGWAGQVMGRLLKQGE